MVIARLPNLAAVTACAALLSLLVACATAPSAPGIGNEVDPTATPQGQPGDPQDRPGNRAQVESVELLLLESFPVQVNALVKGNLADGCTEIDQIEQTRDLDAKAFTVTITTSRDPDKICTQALVPFEETISLDARDLPAGIYTVDVNGVQGTFELQVDNSL